MSVINRESVQLANRDASPQILNDPGVAGGYVRNLMDVVAFVTGDSATSVYRFFQIPSNAIIRSLDYINDAMGTSCTINIGVYETTENGGLVAAGTAANGYLFNGATGLAVATATVSTPVRFSVLLAATANQQLWQLLGLSADPCKFYDICAVVKVATAASGNLALSCSYAA